MAKEKRNLTEETSKSYLKKKALKALKIAKQIEAKRIKKGWKWIHEGKTHRLNKPQSGHKSK